MKRIQRAHWRLGTLPALMLLALSGCHQSDDSGGLLPGYTASRSYDVDSYTLRGAFDWNANRLSATEDISLTVTEPGQAVIELDSAVEVRRIYAGDTQLPFAEDGAQKKLRVDLSSLHPDPDKGMLVFSIDYDAAAQVSLLASTPQDGDPVTARVVATSSEPDLGVYWLIAKHEPAARARFAVELSVAPDEDVIANGTRVMDVTSAGGRRVRYEMDRPLPTYLMAFAAGQLDHTDLAGGRTPLAIWHRRGLMFDDAATFQATSAALATYERLLGPYPWERYSIVLLPQLSGGMENATVTFVGEQEAQAPIDTTLLAHELAHHWFGDWVTMRSYDDVWIKEGLATLLQYEPQRLDLDAESRGRLFGSELRVLSGDAIRDSSLTGLDKYTSGPYGRAAWLLTQVRAAVGDATFFATLRTVLDRYALGSIDSDSFVSSFASALDARTIQKIRDSLDQKPMPAVAIAVQPSGLDQAVTLSLSDPSGALVAPLAITVVDAAGAATVQALSTAAPLRLIVPQGGYLAPDESDVHPIWSSGFSVDYTDFYTKLVPLLEPSSPMAAAAFTSRSAGQQEWALGRSARLPAAATSDLSGFFAALDSTAARSMAATSSCNMLQSLLERGGDVAGFRLMLDPILKAQAGQSLSTGLSHCGQALAEQLFGAELMALSKNLTNDNAGRFLYLASYDYETTTGFAALASAAASAPTVKLRQQAILRLSAQAQSSGYTKVPPAEAPAWSAFFRARLDETTSAARFQLVWPALISLADDSALAALGHKLGTIPLRDEVQRQVVCDAYRVSRLRPAAWAEFTAAAASAALSASAQAVLKDPSLCPTA